jgi:hypothetical protein
MKSTQLFGVYEIPAPVVVLQLSLKLKLMLIKWVWLWLELAKKILHLLLELMTSGQTIISNMGELHLISVIR